MSDVVKKPTYYSKYEDCRRTLFKYGYEPHIRHGDMETWLDSEGAFKAVVVIEDPTYRSFGNNVAVECRIYEMIKT